MASKVRDLVTVDRYFEAMMTFLGDLYLSLAASASGGSSKRVLQKSLFFSVKPQGLTLIGHASQCSC
jgi:hypothetical protein